MVAPENDEGLWQSPDSPPQESQSFLRDPEKFYFFQPGLL